MWTIKLLAEKKRFGDVLHRGVGDFNGASSCRAPIVAQFKSYIDEAWSNHVLQNVSNLALVRILDLMSTAASRHYESIFIVTLDSALESGRKNFDRLVMGDAVRADGGYMMCGI
ncbi:MULTISPECIES: hypothetical protein [unclassified Burkholderia]|uniref:hypothetical protein n=1 Tax=unclassified Burkholderia TaxID=2613784 RepID=UPI000F56218B|nr:MULTISPECIES: hypothetical protein [unclassified Burkholderia]